MTFTELFQIIYKHKKVLLINSLIVAFVTVFVTLFLMDEIFESESTIKSTSKQAGLGALMPEIGGLDELTGGLGSSSAAKELALYENIILSRRCAEEAIQKFNLLEEYEFKKMDDALKFFRKELLTIKIDKLAGTMSIGVFDKDPNKAKNINEFLIFKLNEINVEMSTLDAKNNRTYIEERYDLIKKNLASVEDSLTQYQNIYGVSPDLQIKATAQSLFGLEFELKSEEIKLDLLKKILSPDESEVRIQEEKLKSIQEQISQLRNLPIDEGELGLKGAPGVAMNYLRLARNVEIQNKLLTFIIPILEKSKIDENKTTPTIMVLDPPSLPDKKAKPKRSIIVISFTLLAFLLTLSYYLFKGKWSVFRKSIS